MDQSDESEVATVSSSTQGKQELSAAVQDKIWSLEMLNHPSWKTVFNLVEKYCQENPDYEEKHSRRATKRAKDVTTTDDNPPEKVLRKYEKYKSRYNKYKRKLRPKKAKSGEGESSEIEMEAESSAKEIEGESSAKEIEEESSPTKEME